MEDKTLNENNAHQDNNGKKKKIIIIVAAVVIIAVAAAIIYAAYNKDNGYVDIPVTEIVTDKNGEAVTDAQGEVVTEVVTDSNGETVTKRVKKSRAASASSAASTTAATTAAAAPADNNSGSGSNGENNSGNQGSGSNSKPEGGNKPDDSGNKPEESEKQPDVSEKEPDETKKPQKRNIEIEVIMPNVYGRADTLDIYVDGELWKSDEAVKLNGKTYTFTTDDKYDGDIKIEVRLKTYGTGASSTVSAGNDSLKIALPLNEVEYGDGVDD